MNNKIYIAHSKKPEFGIEEQSFYDHTINVHNRALSYLEEYKPYIKQDLWNYFKNVLEWATLFHDLGKLDDDCQFVLKQESEHKRMLNHVQAGVSYLEQKYKETKKNSFLLSAILVSAHHREICDFPDVIDFCTNEIKDKSPLHDLEVICEKYPQFRNDQRTVSDYVDSKLSKYISIFESICDKKLDDGINYSGKITSLSIRILLSILVDSDHSDTALNYKNATSDNKIKIDTKKAMALLDKYIDGLPKDNSERQKIRDSVYNACKNSDVFSNIVCCKSEVGTGKTTAMLRYALNVADGYNLIRIFMVEPLTHVVSQNANILRKSIVSAGENKFDVVAENHCKIEYESELARIYSTQWSSPYVVTTSVQFQTTLTANRPGSLRKLHNLVGSCIIIDESHMSFVIKNLKIMWPLIIELTENWGCKFILGSGSMIDIGDLKELGIQYNVPSIIPNDISNLTLNMEKNRVSEIVTGNLTINALIKKIFEKKGSKLLVLNTVHTSAVIAKKIKEMFGRDRVEYVSTALSQKDTERAFDRVFLRLKNGDDFVLVATSCVEVGIDFNPSFRYGFKEVSSLMNHMQFRGRINRNNEYKDSQILLFSFEDSFFTKNNFKDGKILTFNEGFRVSKRIFYDMCNEGKNSVE